MKILDTVKTEVNYGGLHAQVWLKDLGLEVEMDSEPGDWGNEDWARKRTWEVFMASLTPDSFHGHMAFFFRQGMEAGQEAAQREMRKALGLGRYGD